MTLKGDRISPSLKAQYPVWLDSISIDHELVEELSHPGSDRRSGVNLVSRPYGDIVAFIQAIQKYLRDAEPDQYYYPASDLHLTVLEICHSRTPAEAAQMAAAVAPLLQAIVNSQLLIDLASPELTFDDRAVALSFKSGQERLDDLRMALSGHLSDLGVCVSPRYKPSSAHVTLMRYMRPLNLSLHSWREHLLRTPEVPNLRWRLSPVWLTWGPNWYGMRSRISESGPYWLGQSVVP